ncbi:MAG: M6 family metalloprotease domain-containing protein [Bacteroidales bacterium]|nr:M6 family metalloprotease domain-containing protein [Bacteroidales bacterium]
MRRPAVILLFLLLALPLWGVRGPASAVKVLQSDGTTLSIRILGDENFSCKTTLDGYIVARGKDGIYYFADYEKGFLNISNIRADSGRAGLSKTIPAAMKQSLLSCPARKLAKSFIPADETRGSVTAVRNIVIPVQFQDIKFTTATPRNRIYNLFNQINYSYDGATGSVRDYFRDNLGSRANLTFEVCDTITLPQIAAYYGENFSGSTDINIKQMVVQACRAADAAGVDFSAFDDDRDGMVDNVFIIFAGHNEAEGGGDDCIWPQCWNIADSQLYLDGVKISNFCCYSEYSGQEGGGGFAGIGIICHELCHLFGLPDMYDVNGDVEGEARGLFGSLSIMDNGGYNNDCKTPPCLTIVERELIGIATPTALTDSGTVTVPPVREATEAFRFRTSYTDENFYIEYRDGEKWDAYAGGSGLVIYHVDHSGNEAGSMTAAQRWKFNAVNACAAHECVRPVSATGMDAENVADLFFPGRANTTVILASETFPLLDWSGRGTGFGIRNIARGVGGMTFEVVEDNAWNLPVIKEHTVQPEQTSASLSWVYDKGLGGEWVLIWGTPASIEADTVTLSSSSYIFEDLTPGKTYFCDIYYLYKGIRGKSYHLEFQTTQMLSSFPLIAGREGVHRVGEEIRLRLHNLMEETTSIAWTVDGVTVTSGVFTPSKEGNCTVKAMISYPDGSQENLVKIIKVEAGDEQSE